MRHKTAHTEAAAAAGSDFTPTISLWPVFHVMRAPHIECGFSYFMPCTMIWYDMCIHTPVMHYVRMLCHNHHSCWPPLYPPWIYHPNQARNGVLDLTFFSHFLLFHFYNIIRLFFCHKFYNYNNILSLEISCTVSLSLYIYFYILYDG